MLYILTSRSLTRYTASPHILQFRHAGLQRRAQRPAQCQLSTWSSSPSPPLAPPLRGVGLETRPRLGHARQQHPRCLSHAALPQQYVAQSARYQIRPDWLAQPLAGRKQRNQG
eukprot:10138301-Alexandrium_andersonii.AAC.1